MLPPPLNTDANVAGVRTRMTARIADHPDDAVARMVMSLLEPPSPNVTPAGHCGETDTDPIGAPDDHHHHRAAHA